MGCSTGSAATPATPATPGSSTTQGGPSVGEVLSPAALARRTIEVHRLYRTHRDAGMVLARSLSSNEQDAEAIFREAFTETVHALNVESIPRFFAAELFTAIRGAAAKWHGSAKGGFLPAARSQGLNAPGERGLAGPDDDGGVGDVPGYTRVQDVLTALRSLPASWQEILWRADVLGEDPGDIAARIGVTRAAVDLLTDQAHEALRTAYQEHNSTGQDRSSLWDSGDPDE
ncbi:RNA polymerase sigma factor [Paenarthrobacter sp. NPDC057355]|uniref:RNA polymerase sigma factor n=1 Tax=Paenarthrobacter sp. NPDC057355 TaxID=3346105 RepID=UPI00363B5C4D